MNQFNLVLTTHDQEGVDTLKDMLYMLNALDEAMKVSLRGYRSGVLLCTPVQDLVYLYPVLTPIHRNALRTSLKNYPLVLRICKASKIGFSG